MKHKHCKIIKKWADGAEIQYLDTFTNDGIWRDIAGRDLNWHPEIQYRIKPEISHIIEQKYKLALFLYREDKDPHFSIITVNPSHYEKIENMADIDDRNKFIRWVTDEMSYFIDSNNPLVHIVDPVSYISGEK